MVAPGDVVIGADSHTCTYGALAAFATGVGTTDFAAAMATGESWFRVPESIKFVFHGQPAPLRDGQGPHPAHHRPGRRRRRAVQGHGVHRLGHRGAFHGLRFTMCNMAIEAGGKSGIVGLDETTKSYLRAGRVSRARLTASTPATPTPPTPTIYRHRRRRGAAHGGQTAPAVQHAAGGRADRASRSTRWSSAAAPTAAWRTCVRRRRCCAGGKVHKDVRCIILPATQAIWMQAMRRGPVRRLHRGRSGAFPPTCGPCLGGHMGVLAEGERAVSTTNRNFVGRMGHVGSEVYLASPYVAAACAVAGHIATPDMSRRQGGMHAMQSSRAPHTPTGATWTQMSSSRPAT